MGPFIKEGIDYFPTLEDFGFSEEEITVTL